MHKKRNRRKIVRQVISRKNNSQLWAFILKKENSLNVQTIIKFTFSIPTSNAQVERFTSINNLWCDIKETQENVKA